MPLRAFLAALLAAAFPALATPQPRDATDMWFDPEESGWGLNVIHQGDTLFATLFVYGSNGQPTWFVGSALTGGPGAYAGALSACEGPWFGGPFSAGPVTCREVGSMRFEPGDAAAMVEYTVDGVRVAKQVRRFSFRRPSLSGTYEGYMLQPAGGGGAEVRRDDLTFQVRDTGTSFEMDTTSDSQAPCLWRGTPGANGQLQSVGGTFQCSGGRTGTWSMTVDPATEGLTGTFSGDGITAGRIAAARAEGEVRMQGHGWRNDMWFLPGESGWGLNVIEQGDILFATLFVYDRERRARWYVASSLTAQGGSSDGTLSYSGALAESTGPYFGSAFNPAAVMRREVGTMLLTTRADGTASLGYTVDGVQVTKQLQRFAFRKQDFSGSYIGSYEHDRQAVIVIDDSGAEFRMRLEDRFGGMGICDFVAPSAQVGSLRTMTGTYSCTTRSGTFTMRHATVSAHGFTARFDSPMFAFRSFVDGHISGARQ